MIHLSSTSAATGKGGISGSLLNKACKSSDCSIHSPKALMSRYRIQLHIQVHIQVTISWNFLINYPHNFRKCLGSIRTFNAPRPHRHKDRCVTLSQDNYSCEVCHSPLRWQHVLSKGRRALRETPGWKKKKSVECRHWQSKRSWQLRPRS